MQNKKLTTVMTITAVLTAMLMGGCQMMETAQVAQSAVEIAEVDVPMAAPAAEDEPVEAEPVVAEPVDAAPVVSAPAENAPAEDEPVEDEPAEDEPVEDEPAEDEPAEDEPVEDEPVEDEPVEDEPVDAAPAVNPNYSRIEWLAEQLATSGTTVNRYFSNRGAKSSLDSTGFNWAPTVNDEMEAANVVGEDEGYTWRIYKIAAEDYNIFWADESAAGMAAGTELENVTLYNTVEAEYVDGTAEVADKQVEGNTIQIIAGGTFEADESAEG